MSDNKQTFFIKDIDANGREVPGIGMCHTVLPDEGFDEAAKALHTLVQESIERESNGPRMLRLDIQGHLLADGSFDDDMAELLLTFTLGVLMPCLSAVVTPIGVTLENPHPLVNDLPPLSEYKRVPYDRAAAAVMAKKSKSA
jgi:hypothetical protein